MQAGLQPPVNWCHRMKHPDFDGEYLTSARLILTLVLGIGCVVSFGAELLSLPWSVVSRTMLLAIVVAFVFVVGMLLCGWRPQVGRWFTLLGLSLLVHAYGLWLEIPGALGWAIIPTAYAACLVSVSAAALTAFVESVWVLLLAQFLGVEGAPAALLSVWALFFAIAAISYQTRQQTKWYAGYFEQAQRLLADVLDHRAELVQALDDLSHANRQLALMNRRVIALQSIAEEAQAAKTRFVARVSHEFRTPLNMIIGLTDLLIEKPENYDAVLSPRMRDALRVVHRNSQHLSDMVNDVLDLSRIETDHVVLRRERVPLRTIIQVAVEAVRPLIENKRLEMYLDIPEGLPDLYCDRTRIEQVVLNLLSNAVRYTDHGSIAIEASQQTRHLCVRVTDTGQGILPQDRERIFEPFAQGTSTVWRNKGGTGLGLSISKQFIELHEGRIWVESELGVGTTFAFELPLSSPIEDLALLQPGARPGQKIQEEWLWHPRRAKPQLPDSHLRPRILVCDEGGSLFDALEHVAEDVELVHTKEKAETMAALRLVPAHALLLNMATLTELHSWVDEIPLVSKGTPVIGCSVPNSLAYARSLGLVGQIIKPVTRPNLARALQLVDTPVRRVLVVDDGADEIELLRQLLRAFDETLTVEAATNGQMALAMLALHPPDLMLLDIVMPDMDGWQVLKTMASDAALPKVPTLFVSAQDPYEQPPRSDFMVVATAEGFSSSQLVRCSLTLSKLLLQPVGKVDPGLR